MIAVILGTRPELIKCAPILLEAQHRGVPIAIIHTGQHYSHELDRVFFRELNLPQPIRNLRVGSYAPAHQIGLMLQGLSAILEELKPDCVLVQGDTNSVLAGALAAHKAGIPVAHLEAGLRSDDWSMPEESNRVLTDRMSRWLFCPTDGARARLADEGIAHAGVHVVGNTVVDASHHYSKIAYEKSDIAERLGVMNRPYALLTMHRPSNVDEPGRLKALLQVIHDATQRAGLMTVFPIHPRTKQVMQAHQIKLPGSFLETDPLGYLDLLRLQGSAHIVLTDSGGIQEEACILRVPSITLRPNTERPETLRVGASILHHELDADLLFTRIQDQMRKTRDWENPFGDGKTAGRVLDILTRDMQDDL